MAEETTELHAGQRPDGDLLGTGSPEDFGIFYDRHARAVLGFLLSKDRGSGDHRRPDGRDIRPGVLGPRAVPGERASELVGGFWVSPATFSAEA